MNFQKISNQLFRKPNIVGTIHSAEGLRAALKLKVGDLDFLEVRVDSFAGEPDRILHVAPKLRIPLVITIRHHREGGAAPVPLVERRRLFDLFLPHATLIDIELRSVKALASTIEKTKASSAGLILSHHDFKRTPAASDLDRLAARAHQAGADVFKVASVTSSCADFAKLLAFMDRERRLPLSVMGMGRFGKVSRLLFAQAGSVLNYGFLHHAQVSGQWPAQLLKQRVEELLNAE